MTSGFRREVDENCALLGCYAPSSGNLYSNMYPTRCNFTQFIYNWKLLYTFRVEPPTHHQERIQLYLQHLVFVTPLLLPAAVVEELELRSNSSTVWQIPDAVDTFVCTPNDGWRFQPKRVEQFPDINKLCKVASCWIYIGIYLRCTHP